MIGRAELPPTYVSWNKRWGAPNGDRLARGHTFRSTARKRGPFGFQPNNLTRTFEFPWAYFTLGPRPGLTVVEVGGALSGLQFALSSAGTAVTNVDPFIDYGSEESYEGVEPQKMMRRLNRVFRTDVRLIQSDLAGAEVRSESVDAVLAISTLEHLDPRALASVLQETARVLKHGGRLIATIDLFLDLVPFTEATANQYGRNLNVFELVRTSELELLEGNTAELNGYPDFDPVSIQQRLDEYLVGNYPALAQCLVLIKR